MKDIILDDEENTIPVISLICLRCEHFNEGTSLPDGVYTGTCRAFPEGIPTDIWLGEDPHTESREGDGGVVFELKEQQPNSGSA